VSKLHNLTHPSPAGQDVSPALGVSLIQKISQMQHVLSPSKNSISSYPKEELQHRTDKTDSRQYTAISIVQLEMICPHSELIYIELPKPL